MSHFDNWSVREVDRKRAMSLIIENHYLHRRAPCSIAFGLFDETDRLRGVVMYGVPASPFPRRGIAGNQNESIVGELTRLWCDDETPKNAESFLIGNSIRKQPFEILLSFAEVDQGHRGVVYQATNWIYTGLSAKHVQWEIDGKTGHSRHMFDQWGGVKGAKEALGDNMKRTERPRKHRYVFINAKGRRRKELTAAIKYATMPYPKA